jgi:hypothetical protein
VKVHHNFLTRIYYLGLELDTRCCRRIQLQGPAIVFRHFAAFVFPDFLGIQSVIAKPIAKRYTGTVGLDLDLPELAVPGFVVGLVLQCVVG